MSIPCDSCPLQYRVSTFLVAILREMHSMTPSSMTGYGSAQADCPAGRLSVELKSVNNRFFEFTCRMPDEFRWLEGLCRDKTQASVHRGKVECRITLTRTESSLAKTQIHPAGLASALRLAHEIRGHAPDITPFSVNDLLRLPGVTIESQLSADDWSVLVSRLLDEALVPFHRSRHHEGARLMEIIRARLDEIEALVQRARAILPETIRAQEQKLSDKLQDALRTAVPTAAVSPGVTMTAAQADLLSERIRQEAAVFGLRIDVAEELDRLFVHLQSARQTLSGHPTDRRSGASSGIGKRLDFLTQEMNREANTLGSKSASAELSTLSIEIKLLIEQIREQAQNLE